jgi:enamine deaminase RidA (YjgF/YER057c/UK114 family)
MAPPGRASAPPADPDPAAPTTGGSLVAQLGVEVAAAMSSALERVNALARTGHIDRPGLRALRDEVEHARRLGMLGQQLGRLASGRVALAPAPLDLTAMVREVLAQRDAEVRERGLEVRQALRPAIVVTDSTLVFSLLQSVLDWSLQHARSPIEVGIERKGAWPAPARLVCAFAHLPVDEAAAEPLPPAPPPQSMTWRVLEQTAHTLALPLSLDDAGGRIQLGIEFPRSVAEVPEATTTIALTGAAASSSPLVGAHVLVIASRREVRTLVRDALRPRAAMLDFVTSVDEARAFCDGALPHAVVHEAALGGERLERLRYELLARAPRTAFIQITEDDKTFELRDGGSQRIASVGRGAIAESLAPALTFALTRAT